MQCETKNSVDHRANAIPATASKPAATDPTFLVAAPVKPEPDGFVEDPVVDGATGAIGEPVAAAELEPEPMLAAVPVATGAVPVAKPVEPATAVEL